MNVRKGIHDNAAAIANFFQEQQKNQDPFLRITPTLLKSLLGTKGVHCEVFEITDENEEKQIVATYLGFDKKIIQSNKELKKNAFLKELCKQILYDFTLFIDLVAETGTQEENYKRMMMMSYLDETKKKTVMIASKFPVPTSIKQQIEFFRFKEEKIIQAEGEEYQLFELDN